MAVSDAAGEEEVLDCEDGLRRRTQSRRRELQGLESQKSSQVCGNQDVCCGY